jgi:hypothetical protein
LNSNLERTIIVYERAGGEKIRCYRKKKKKKKKK